MWASYFWSLLDGSFVDLTNGLDTGFKFGKRELFHFINLGSFFCYLLLLF